MESIQITSGKEYLLSKLPYEDIFLIRVASPVDEFRHLMSFIQIISTYPDGRKVIIPFHPGSYASIYIPQAVTEDFVEAMKL